MLKFKDRCYLLIYSRIVYSCYITSCCDPDWWHRTQPDGCSCQQLWVEIRFLLKKKYLYLSISSYPSIHPSIRVCVETYVIQLNSLWGLATLHGWGIQGSVVTRVDEQIDMGQNPWDHNLGDYHAFTLPAMHLALWPTTRSTKLGLPFFKDKLIFTWKNIKQQAFPFVFIRNSSV